MGLKDKLLGTDDGIKEFPDEFEPTSEVQQKIDQMKPGDIKDFLTKGMDKPKDKPVEKKPEPKVEDKIPEPVTPLEEEVPLEEKAPESKISSNITVYITPKNFDKSKELLEKTVNADYKIGVQAGIMVDKENFESVTLIMKQLVERGYLVVFNGEKVEPVF